MFKYRASPRASNESPGESYRLTDKSGLLVISSVRPFSGIHGTRNRRAPTGLLSRVLLATPSARPKSPTAPFTHEMDRASNRE